MVNLKELFKTKPKQTSASKTSASLHALGYRFLGDKPAKRFFFTKQIHESLIKSDLKVNFTIYISSMFFWSISAFIATIPVSLLLFSAFMPLLGVAIQPVLLVVYCLLTSLLVGGVTFGIFIYYPSYVASSVKRKIEKDLVYTVNYMSILSGAGATPEETFASLARVGKVFGLAESAKTIMKNIEFLGEDTITAIDEESKNTPSNEYAEFLQGYIATTQTGGSSKVYLEAMAEKFMESQKRQMSKVIEQLNMAGEIFVAALVAFPTIMVTMLSIMGFFGGNVLGGLSAVQLMTIMTYVLIPFIAVGILVFIDAAMSSW